MPVLAADSTLHLLVMLPWFCTSEFGGVLGKK